jgi:CHAT domain-containing protein
MPEGARRLVVPDGSLGAVPWGLLGRRDTAVTPTLQLASVHSVLQSRPDAPAWASTGLGRLALFGDPIYDVADPRLATAHALPTQHLERPLARLPGTARELEAIAALATPGSASIATGADATRDALLTLPPGGADVLHVAAHATLDVEIPALAALVLSRRNARGEEVAAELRPTDLASFLARPRLVVLSACDAAAEPSRSAPGLMNLTRAFLGAGASYVVASRWAVGDASAVALMTEFYRGLLHDALPPDAALARAQHVLASSPSWQAPYHWAGFVVTGAAP